MPKKISLLQEKWAIYFAETGNGSEAARRAGYSQKYANRISTVNQKNLLVMACVQEYIRKIEDESIAKAQEVIQYLTRVLRGEENEEVVILEGLGDGVSEARKIKKELQPKDRLKAAELLAKRYGLLTDNIQLGENPKVIDDI